ncbi:MAG: TPR end-of-group domain-containing protein [Pyrinomonadaceae bacterium]
MEKKVFGVLLLIGGIVVAIFGFLYMNSAQYQAMSMLNSLTGSRSDSTGTVAIVIGAILSVIGLVMLVGGTSSGDSYSSNPDPNITFASPEASILIREGKEKMKNKDDDGAIEDFERVLDIQPIAPMTNYYLAQLYSVKENKGKAFAHLSLAIEQGFKDFTEMNSAPRLNFLRSQPEFREYARNGYKFSSVKSSDNEDFITKLERLGKLKSEGLITEEEYVEQKSKLLIS